MYGCCVVLSHRGDDLVKVLFENAGMLQYDHFSMFHCTANSFLNVYDNYQTVINQTKLLLLTL